MFREPGPTLGVATEARMVSEEEEVMRSRRLLPIILFRESLPLHIMSCTGAYSPYYRTIYILRGMTRLNTVVTLIHELLHHVIELMKWAIPSLGYLSPQTKYDSLWGMFVLPITSSSYKKDKTVQREVQTTMRGYVGPKGKT